MVTIPEKLMKQLEELVKDKVIITYSQYTRSLYLSLAQNTISECRNSIVKITTPMTIPDLFVDKDVDYLAKQKQLELTFNLENEVEQLNKIKNSIDVLKNFCNNTNKENK